MTLSRWVPQLLRARLAEAAVRRDAARAVESVDAAVLWLDISGFTSLTRRLAEQGPRGAELVSGVLDRCYGTLTDRIAAAGGDVIDFAGDGILAIWPAREGTSLASAVDRAARCARELQSALDRSEVMEGVELRLYAGLGAGTLALLDVGGAENRWRFLLAGDPLVQMGRAKAACAAGDVVLSPEATAIQRAAAERVERPEAVHELADGGTATPTADATDETALRAYIADEVLRRVDAGQAAWLAEFRRASIVFVVVPTASFDAPTLRLLRDAVRLGQERVHALGGSLNQVVMDDTGLVLLAAWGVPDHTHEDDARRAMQAADDVHAAIGALGLAVRAGVATGRVWCGACGNERRARYAIVGDTVNRAARIALASPTQARCDDRTREDAARWLDFESDEPLRLKGLDEPVAVHRSRGVRAAERGAGHATALSGRARERALLANALQSGATATRVPLLVIEGEAGIGKSVLLRHLAAEAGALGRPVFAGAADAVERHTNFFAWREPFRALFRLDATLAPAAARDRIAEALRPLDGRAERLPLLEPVLGVGFKDNETTAAMAGADRGVATRELLADAFALLAGDTPVVLLDDLHWFDSASLALIEAIRARAPRALVAVGTRPTSDDTPPALAALIADADSVRIPLVEMGEQEVRGMICRALAVETIPDALGQYLATRGEGHPLFTIELALLLREMGVIRIEGRQCAFDPDDARLGALSFSARAEGIVATRIDRLDPAHQLALKVAAVVGRSFEFQLVQRVYPIAAERPALRTVLEDLTRPRLIEEEHPDPALAYLFRHVVIREVAYGLVSFAQRRGLHAEVARALEAAGAGEDAQQLPLLAHHWLLAEEPAPALRYLERAAREALHRGSGREARRFLEDALALLERERAGLPDVTPATIAELERLMGEAMEQLLDLGESSRWLRSALARLGYAAPEVGSPQRRALLVRQAFAQFGHLVWPPTWRPKPTPAHAATLALCARAFGTLAEHCYFDSDVGGMLLFSLTSVNLAERAQAPEAAERSYVTLAHTAGLAGATALLHRYRARSANTTLGRNRAFREIEVAGRALARGRFAEASAAGERAAQLARRFADRHHEAQGWGAIVSASLRLGNIASALDASERILATGHLDWGLAGRCNASIISGRPAGALQRYAEMETWEPAFALSHLSARTLWAEERGDLAEAQRCAARALDEIERPGLKNAFTTGHYANLLGFHSRWLHSAREDAEERGLALANIRRLRTELKRHARVIHIARPRLAQASAMLALVAGERRTGARLLAQGLRIADGMQMAPEVVGLLLELVRWNLPGAAAARARALAICESLGLERLGAEVAATDATD